MAVKVFKGRQFVRWAKSEKLSDKALCVAAREIEHGLVDAKLGGFLIKKRIAKDHKGKSRGPRTIVAYRREDRLFFSSVLPNGNERISTSLRREPCSRSAVSTWR